MPVESHRLPLLRDWHTHPLLYAAFADGVNLGEEAGASRESAIAWIREHAAARGGSGWTIGYAWNSGRYPLAARDFDGLPPVVVMNLSLHGLIVNQSGRELLRAQSPDIAHHLDDQEWIERNLLMVLNLFALDGSSPDRLRRFFDHLLTHHGIHAVDEMLLVGPAEIASFDEAGLANRVRFWAAPGMFDALPPAMQRRVHGIKLFTDGALGTRSAALLAPYPDGPGGTGMLLYSDDELAALLGRYGRHPLAIHAIGDRAIEQVVKAVEATRPAGPVRMEHAQFITEPVALRARTLGMTLCMQPNFSDDAIHYRDRLPAGYPEKNNPFRMLIDSVGFRPGEDLVFGSDGMPHGVSEALRQSLFPPHSGQVLTLDEFRAGYCLDDHDPGHIDVTIDRAARSVSCRIVC
ncbi:MAG TPA: amidohydrolase family protein [Candidatus Eisenbacteria bacterium]